MPSVSKSRSKWRVRIRLHGLPSVSKVFKTKQTAKIWEHKTEQAMMMGDELARTEIRRIGSSLALFLLWA